ncbi:MAG: 16S rRNA (cytosine(967)-C(5))-methyltransferase RsmB [Ruminococcaceae bacterium]|nr:16S rRNA (cytosine(967)-C(5))-methyltransferase RsmB [Oscillospiraceae bacterium]
MQNPRKLSLNILLNIEKNASYINIELDNALNKSDLSPVDKRFVTELVHGVTKWKIYLDYVIFLYSGIKRNKMSDVCLVALRLGVYQILFLDKIPDSAAVNESVKLVKKNPNPKIAGFVNGLLRTVIRNRENIKLPEDKMQYLSVKYSYPLYLTEILVSSLGFDECERFMEAQSKRATVYLRCNNTKTSVYELKDKLSKKISVDIYHNSFFPTLDYCIRAEKMISLNDLEEFNKGHFYVQDISSSVIGEVIDPKENSLVIDVCAAPGGKTTHIGEKMQNTGKVIAFDEHPHKIKLIEENANRLGLTNIYPKCFDSKETNKDLVGKADYVLVDAPCSGLGIISRKPDIKYSVTKEDILSLSEESYKILCASSQYVKNGGVLVFSLCTVTREESVINVERFLEEHSDFSLEKIDCIDVENSGYVTLLPHKHNCDGFFVCKMKRKEM